ncbi:hypothetical protein J5I95_13815 [Candidatus Poribacteria bacterium]|nr:hypothetical protein [Candidatus Poribacteria bacterium]
MQTFSTAYDPCIYEFFFTRQTGNTDDDIVVDHHRYAPATPQEIEELKTAALAWLGLPPPPDAKAVWKPKLHTQQGHEKARLEYAIELPDRDYLFLTIQGK